MSRGITPAAHAPPMLFADGVDFLRSSTHCFLKHGIRIAHRQPDANDSAAQRFRTEVFVFTRLVSHPKLRAINGKPGHHAALRSIESQDSACAERWRF